MRGGVRQGRRPQLVDLSTVRPVHDLLPLSAAVAGNPVMVYERVVVDPPPDANSSPVRARSPEEVARMRSMQRAGASISDIAKAFEISARTAYRYLADDSTVVTVTAGPWTAQFAVDGNRQPRRLTLWERS